MVLFLNNKKKALLLVEQSGALLWNVIVFLFSCMSKQISSEPCASK